jgi:hypothetical protein
VRFSRPAERSALVRANRAQTRTPVCRLREAFPASAMGALFLVIDWPRPPMCGRMAPRSGAAVAQGLTSSVPHRDDRSVRAETDTMWWLSFLGGGVVIMEAASLAQARLLAVVNGFGRASQIRRRISHRRPARGTGSRPFCRTDTHPRGGPAVAQANKTAEVTRASDRVDDGHGRE